MSTDNPMDEVRRTVEQLTAQEVSVALDQIAALETVEPDHERVFRNTMIELPAPPARVAALTVRIEVDEVVPAVWRQVVVPGDLTLDLFHRVIQRAVGWEDYHLHRFWVSADAHPWRSPYLVTDADLAEGEHGTHEREVRLDQVLRQVGDQLRYVYDFGDDWFHTIRLESVGELGPDAPPAVCTAGEMAGPLEDSGGPAAYNDLVSALADEPPLATLEEHVREWLPEGWDPTGLDLERVNILLSVVGATAAEVFELVASTPDRRVELPASLAPLLEIAPAEAVAELAWLSRSAASVEVTLDAEDLRVIARPYRLLLELAGSDGIPLTQAGWMKPAVVHEIFTTIGFDWIGKGNREDQTLPVAELRQRAQELGLLRKLKGRLVRTRKAQQLRTDRDVVEVLAAGLLRHKDPYLAAARGLFALLSAVQGRSDLSLADEVAAFLTGCGLRTGPTGVERWDVVEMLRPTWWALDGHLSFRGRPPRSDERATGLALAALWPGRLTEMSEAR